MSTLISCYWSSRFQKVGRTEFKVLSRYCGYETIFQKLTRLMEDDLDELQELEKELAE